jgi:hypothetical protein
MEMKGRMRIGLTVFSIAAVLSLGRPAVAAPDIQEAKKQSAEMLKEANAMVEHGHSAHPSVMTKHAKAMIESAQKVLDSIPPGNTAGQAAADHIKSAIEQAKITITDQSVDNAEQAFNHATEADNQIQQMK